MKKIYLVLFLLVLSYATAQQESYYSLYRYQMNVINPAYAGAEASNMFFFTSRQQWASMDNAPSTLAFSYSSARKNNVGLGISLVSDKVFVEQQTFAYVDFSYKLEMNENTQLYLGLKGGGNFYNADPSGLATYSIFTDPTKQQISSFNPNVGVGAFLNGEKFWVSFSIPRLFNATRDRDLAITSKDRVHSYLGGGAYLPLSSNLLFKPSLLIRKVSGLSATTDLTAMLNWKSVFEFGASFRTSSAMSVMSVIALGNFEVGYAYEVPTESSLSQLNLKTHELLLRFNLGKSTQESDSNEEEEG